MTHQDRFWRCVGVGTTADCWLWRGRRHGRTGRALFRADGRQHYAARWLFEATVRPLAPDERVLHRCDNVACVNPAHLFVGTQLDNIRDRDAKGASGSRGVVVSELHELLLELEEYLDDRADVKDGPYGEPVPNRAMQLLNEVRRELDRVGGEGAGGVESRHAAFQTAGDLGTATQPSEPLASVLDTPRIAGVAPGPAPSALYAGSQIPEPLTLPAAASPAASSTPPGAVQVADSPGAPDYWPLARKLMRGER